MGAKAFVTEPALARRFEPRWPVALSVLVVSAVLALLPGRQTVMPDWAPLVVGIAVLGSVVAVGLTAGRAPWVRIERFVTLFFFLFATCASLANLANLVGAMVYRSNQVSGIQLLASSVALWITNVFVFSMLYWQVDRGGPEPRIRGTSARPDWLFPQEGAPARDVAPDWRPRFVNYLYLAYSTATAFSTCDVVPLTSRAQLLMMLESAISLMTIVVVASRAINILGS